MKLFGSKKAKPPTVTRFGGMRILRVNRRGITTTRQNIIYLRQASALSAAVVKNISSTLNQPDEFTQESDSSTEESFLDAHSRYSFITVLTLMSLFMVVTITATGLMLAFYRKKNSVFVANSKTDADSQFELDDIDSGDTETCRRDKGECYVHLSEESDEDDEVFDECCENREFSHRNTAGRRTKRSMTFPQLNEVLKRRKSIKMYGEDSTAKDRHVSNAATPLIRSTTSNCKTSAKPRSYHVHQSSHNQESNKLSYQNPNPQHSQHPIHLPHCSNCHIKSSSTARFHHGTNHKHHLPSNGLGKLRRSHTIHAIPQTVARLQSRSSAREGFNLCTRESNQTSQASHRKITNSAQVEPDLAPETSHRPSHHVALDTHHQTRKSSRLEHNHSAHEEYDAYTNIQKRNQKDNRTYKTGSTSVVPTSHVVAVGRQHQTISDHLRHNHNAHQEDNAYKNTSNQNQERNRTYKAGSSSAVPPSHHVEHHTAKINGARRKQEQDQTLSIASSFDVNATSVHSPSSRTTPFCPQMPTISNPHSTKHFPQETDTLVLSTMAAKAKCMNSQSLLRDSQPIQATDESVGLLHHSFSRNTFSSSIPHTGETSALTSSNTTRLPPPPKSSSKRQPKHTKEPSPYPSQKSKPSLKDI